MSIGILKSFSPLLYRILIVQVAAKHHALKGWTPTTLLVAMVGLPVTAFDMFGFVRRGQSVRFE